MIVNKNKKYADYIRRIHEKNEYRRIKRYIKQSTKTSDFRGCADCMILYKNNVSKLINNGFYPTPNKHLDDHYDIYW